MSELVAILKKKDLESLASLRADENLFAAVKRGRVWVRGIPNEKTPDIRVLKLPLEFLYVLNEEGYLFPRGGLTPVNRLPELEWQPLSELIPFEMPVSALPGQTDLKVEISLAPSDRNEKGEALLTSLATWKQYAASAPQVRLIQLRFAASEHGYALIMGNPLPPIPGKEYWIRNQILLPCGFDFEIPVVAGLVAHKLNPDHDSWLLFDTRGRWEKIPVDGFVKASRSAVRLSKGGEDHG